MLSWRRKCSAPFKLPLGGFQLTGACPDVVSGYNASFRFLGTWTVGVIFPGDTEHIIRRTKRFSRSETPGEPLGQPERGKIMGLGQFWAPQLPGWNYTPQDPAKPTGEADFGAGLKKSTLPHSRGCISLAGGRPRGFSNPRNKKSMHCDPDLPAPASLSLP